MSLTGLEVSRLTLSDVALHIRSGEISPVEIMLALLDRIDSLDGVHNAYIEVFREKALAKAKTAEYDLRNGNEIGQLHGVPISIKDNIASQGDLTRAGSHILSDQPARKDATLTRRLKGSGAVILGHLNMHEFAFGVTSDNPHYGPVLNPWNFARLPGGSSGGSAVAVAARTAIGAIGTDTGCSIRIPASLNGVTGLRPTIGRVSTTGVVPLAWSLDTAGPICQTAYDSALVLNSIQGFDRLDPQSVRHPVIDFTEGIGRGVKGTRIGVVRNYSLDKLQPDVERSVTAAMTILEDAGATLCEVDIQQLNLEEIHSALLTIHGVEAAAFHGDWLRERPQDYGADVLSALRVGSLHFGTQYVNAQRYRVFLSKKIAEIFENVDLLLTPTSPFVAPALSESEVSVSREVSFDLVEGLTRYTSISPLTGIPAISFPCGFSEDGLPIGLQLMAKQFDEATLLRAAHTYQLVTDWHKRIPVLV